MRRKKIPFDEPRMATNGRVDCRDYEKGRSLGRCDGMGHYMCDTCKYRKPKKDRYER